MTPSAARSCTNSRASGANPFCVCMMAVVTSNVVRYSTSEPELACCTNQSPSATASVVGSSRSMPSARSIIVCGRTPPSRWSCSDTFGKRRMSILPPSRQYCSLRVTAQQYSHSQAPLSRALARGQTQRNRGSFIRLRVPCPRAGSGTETFGDEWATVGDGVTDIPDSPGTGNRLQRSCKPRRIISVQRKQRLPCPHVVTRLRVQVDPCPVRDGILFARSTGTESPGGDPKRQRLLRHEHPITVSRDRVLFARCRQRSIRITALSANRAPPRVHRPTIFKRRGHINIRMPRHREHLPRERNGELTDILRPTARKYLDRFAHLVRVTDCEAEWHVHVGEQGGCRNPRVCSQLHHRPSQLSRPSDIREERARPELHVEHQRPCALGYFLRHDRRRNKWDRLDRPGDITQRVKFLVGGGGFGAGRADDAAHLAQLREHLGTAEGRAPPRNRLQFVERATGVPQPTPRQLRYRNPEGCHERHERQGDLVTNTPG